MKQRNNQKKDKLTKVIVEIFHKNRKAGDTIAQFKPHKTACNESTMANVLDREFKQTESK
ncbi:hypothetical protein C0Q44_18230 [Paenibacillus sp. PCH8]|uniref:hypothetical protein n=1 Tax=Paenibacillus sp. PCH8 TaxID=2066524 RepID=UPI000CF8C7AE|nr:hypothetical protein [Paenibacillus sp. PCH8]PQP81639.1 hypothetical protein C0Q44_18230 [Paenibacillus sp. PCH8]